MSAHLHEYEQRAVAAYRILHPCKPSKRGVKAWFRRELLNRTGLPHMTEKTVGRWLSGRHPMPVVGVEMIVVLEAEALRELDRLKETIG